MQKYFNKLLLMILVAFMLVSCGGAAPTDEVDINTTAVIETMVVSFFETQTALAPSATATPTPSMTPFPTPTGISSSATFSLNPTATFIYLSPTLGSITPTGTLTTATINPGALAVGCNNLYFIRDVTLPAGTVLQKKQPFTKTWKVQNVGTCDWLYQYSLVLISGEIFEGKEPKIQKLVKVGDWTELSVGGITPNKAGTYTSYWRLSSGQGPFGATLVLSFKVEDPATSTPVPTITNTPTPTPTPTNTFTPSPTNTETPTPTPTL